MARPKWALIGMLHLPPLPGSPGSRSSLAEIEASLIGEARLLHEVGFHGAMVENFGDLPFFKDRVAPVTIAAMTRLAGAVKLEVPELALGINVLRNDAAAALAIAFAVEADFMRVNVHVGATATDQGIIEGRAAETLRARAGLGADVEIWADLQVKHGRSLAHDTIGAEAEDAVERGLADAVIVSGTGTGRAASFEDLKAVREHDPGVPIYVGSGVTERTIGAVLEVADGVIVGTSLKVDGKTTGPIDPVRARRLVEVAGRSL